MSQDAFQQRETIRTRVGFNRYRSRILEMAHSFLMYLREKYVSL